MITKVASKKLAKCSAKKPGGQWSQEQRGDIGCTCPKIKGNWRTEEECISGTFVGHKVGEYETEEEAAKAYDTCEYLKDDWNKRNMDLQTQHGSSTGILLLCHLTPTGALLRCSLSDFLNIIFGRFSCFF